MSAYTSAWEFEQARDATAAIDRVRGGALRRLGEVGWTGRTDNSGLGVRTLRELAEVVEDDYDEDWDR